ncbi:hypothetical protein PRIC1_005374 [Phytophthora ramorum]
MPCTIKIRLVEARDMPVVDRTSKLADAYVGITFASFEAKSSVSKKTLNPKWDEEFRFDVAASRERQCLVETRLTADPSGGCSNPGHIYRRTHRS